MVDYRSMISSAGGRGIHPLPPSWEAEHDCGTQPRIGTANALFGPAHLDVPHRGSLRRIYHSTTASSSSSSRSKVSSSASSQQSAPSQRQHATTSASSFTYAIPISVPPYPEEEQSILPVEKETYELAFDRHQYEFCSRLFSLLDTESRGSVGQAPIRNFVQLRCPVFRRRDETMRKLAESSSLSSAGERRRDDENDDDPDPKKCRARPRSSTSISPTFDEVWRAVVTSDGSSSSSPEIKLASAATATNDRTQPPHNIELGVEGWMVFCRLIALAQYQEAKRRFASRHLQQTMRHKHGVKGSEVVLVKVPPPDPPAPLTVRAVMEHERTTQTALALPELDLDHCLVSSHDTLLRSSSHDSGAEVGHVSVSLFGGGILSSSPISSLRSSSSSNLEFVLAFRADGQDGSKEAITGNCSDDAVVRRTFSDLEWLHETFLSHKQAGTGTLCGRILPPFPKRVGTKLSLEYTDENASRTSGGGGGGATAAMGAVAKSGVGMAKSSVGMIKDVAKSIWGTYVTSSSSSFPSAATAKDDAPPQQSRKSPHQVGDRSSGRRSRSGGRMDDFADTPLCKARQLERYLNYLLEHPALSTSFPLNAILKASQSGLESAKRTIEENARSNDRWRKQMPQMDEGKISSLLSWTSLASSVSSSNHHVDMSWVRTAAQAAMALQLHGILESTGCQSASAKLQHASLPDFGVGATGKSTWDDDDDGSADASKPLPSRGKKNGSHIEMQASEGEGDDCFERGVVNIDSGLDLAGMSGDGGYDMLPAPAPSSEKSVLCAGSVDNDDGGISSNSGDPTKSVGAAQDTRQDGIPKIPQKFYYGDPSRRIRMGLNDDEEAALGDFSVDEDIDKLRDIIGAVDNTLGRCFAASVGIGKARRKRNVLHLDIVRGMDSWGGMRGEIIGQRALLGGVALLESGSELTEENSKNLSEDLYWQASLATSAVSAAEDVRSAVRASRTASGAKAAAEAAAKTAQHACDTGKFSSIDEARAAQTRASISQSHAIHAAVVEHEALAAKRRAAMALAHDVKCWNVHRKRELLKTCQRAACAQRDAARKSVDAWLQLHDGLLNSSTVPFTDERRESDRKNDAAAKEQNDFTTVVMSPECLEGTTREGLIVPVDHIALSPIAAESATSTLGISGIQEEEDFVFAESRGASSYSSLLNDSEQTTALKEDDRPEPMPQQQVIGLTEGLSGFEKGDLEEDGEDTAGDNDVMTSSMQSLIDGLMTWGGQYDSGDDLTLPTGMAASIALEESGMLG